MAYALTAEDEAAIRDFVDDALAALVIPAANAQVSTKADLATAVAASRAIVAAYTFP